MLQCVRASSLDRMQVTTGADGLARCSWAGSAPEYLAYHDEEWGRPVADDQKLFEKLCLESFQSGLAWITVLRKRPAFRAAFHQFDPEKVADMNEADVEHLLTDSSIIRHRGKIESAINNARRTLVLQRSQSLASLVWSFEPVGPSPEAAMTPESKALAKSLKIHGFTWLGPTTVYAFMQAMGLVNDHAVGCAYHQRIDSLRGTFERP